jgi:hypothetical protein
MARRITEIAEIDSAEIVALLGEALDRGEAEMTSEASRARLAQGLYDFLRTGTLAVAQVLDWYRAGNPTAEAALRRYAAEELDAGRDTALLRGFAVEMLAKPLLRYPQGGRARLIDNLNRDVAITCIARTAAPLLRVFPLTRGRGTTLPSVAYFLSIALRKRGVRLKEQQINRIILGHGKLAERLEAAMPTLAMH